MKVLRDPAPVTAKGVAYSAESLEYFWDRLQPLASGLDLKMATALKKRQPGKALSFAVKKTLDRAAVFTITGRMRAKASYSARRNTVFQGPASDGAKLALYRLWRAGFQVVAFIHDEVIIEVDATCNLAATKKQIDDILVASMKEICPDLLIEVEGGYYRRWGKDKADEVLFGSDNRSTDSTEASPIRIDTGEEHASNDTDGVCAAVGAIECVVAVHAEGAHASQDVARVDLGRIEVLQG